MQTLNLLELKVRKQEGSMGSDNGQIILLYSVCMYEYITKKSHHYVKLECTNKNVEREKQQGSNY